MSTKNQISSLHVGDERALWEQVKGRWQLVHGGMLRQGFSLEFHDFSERRPLNWSESFHEHSLEICVNLHGSATFRRGASTMRLSDNEVAIYTVPTGNGLSAIREAGGHHYFYTLEFSRDWLRENLRHSQDRLKPEIRRFITRPDRSRAHVECFTLPPAMIPIRIDLLAPPIPDAARDAWYFGKAFEILALTVYEQAKFVRPTERRNRERAEKARALIDHSFENPPTLDELAKEAGCSPFHLSRMFKHELGVCISDYQRAIRMEKAAEFLREGMSVTETATAVGYSNVSAFIKTFGSHHCTTPSRWASLWHKEASRTPALKSS
jgi:AraC-like DNA-binding protein